MYICKDKSYIVEDIFEGRNSEWFGNMQKEGEDEVYDSLPIKRGVSDEAPDAFSEEFSDDWCFGFRYLNVKEFKHWFIEKRPDEDAGWVTRYEEWAYENKGIEPVYLQKRLDHDDIIEDMRFIEVTNKYDCSAWLYDYLVNNHIPDVAIIQYCFDN
jgi:hypothetical protein